jgi:hypothetical protein
MNRDDLVKLVRQHGKAVQEQNSEVNYLFTIEGIYALLDVEREACCQIVYGYCGSDNVAARTVEAIKARGT